MNLEKNLLITRAYHNSKKVFFITDKGREFLREYKNYVSFIERMGLE